MKIKADLHCHTVASTHAYSTVIELAEQAKQAGIEVIAITDHAPAIPDAPHIWHFENIKTIPRIINGVKILYGVEANILNLKGELDMPERLLKRLDIVVASIHEPCYSDLGAKDNTSAYMNAVENPYVDIIGHSGDPRFKYDYETVILRAKELHKIMEINEHSFNARKSSVPNCTAIAKLCKKHGVPISVDSDAHFAYDIGNYPKALEMLKSIEFPDELIINADLNKLREYLKPRKELCI